MNLKPSNLLRGVTRDVSSTLGSVSGAAKNVAGKIGRDAFDAGKAVTHAPADVGHAVGSVVNHPSVTGGDGFVAVDPNGQIVGGRAPSAEVRALGGLHGPADPLMQIVSPGEQKPVSFTMPDGKTVTSPGSSSGADSLSLSQLSGLSQGLNPQRGGIAQVQVSSANAAPTQANVLVLPKNYDGPIFVCDIDDTLRATSMLDLAKGKTQAPIDGAKQMLDEVAAAGVPIIYLSAGPNRIRSANDAFLKQLPPGVLLDRSNTSLADEIPINSREARDQGSYKAGVLGQLKETYPNAKMFGIGDDKYGDAEAYTQQGVTAFIHDVKPDHSNLPANFHGTLTGSYTPDFISNVVGDLKQAISTSASFGNTPPVSNSNSEMATISKQLDAGTNSTLTQGNVVQPFVDGENAFPQIISTLDSAKKTINYESYQFVDGQQTSTEVAQHLIAAAKRGVHVRVVVDAVGSRVLPLHPNHLVDQMRAAGIDVQVYSNGLAKDLIDPHLDHRKSIVVDGSTAFVGGMNTGDQYMGGPNVPGRLHDVFSKITGPAVAQVQTAFLSSWAAAGGPPVPASDAAAHPAAPDPNGVPMRIITHVPGKDENIRSAYLTLIDNAKTQLNVENDYPMSDDLVDALCAAAKRGVNVRYIVGSNPGVMNDDTQKNYQRLMDAGAHVYVYPDPIHTKSLSVDGQICTFGSSNVDNFALSRDREIIGMVQDPKFTQNYDQKLFNQDVVGDPRGKKTVELKNPLDESLLTKIKDATISGLWPNSWE